MKIKKTVQLVVYMLMVTPFFLISCEVIDLKGIRADSPLIAGFLTLSIIGVYLLTLHRGVLERLNKEVDLPRHKMYLHWSLAVVAILIMIWMFVTIN